LGERKVLKEPQGYAGQIHVAFNGLHGVTDFLDLGLAES